MPDPDPKLIEAIAFFEQMLQTMPDDRTSLEFLSVAYEQTGQIDKHRDCLIRLADCLVKEKDFEHAQSIVQRLSAFSDYAPARAAVERVTERIQSQILEETAAAPEVGGAPEKSAGVAPAPGMYQDAGLEVHALSRAASSAEMELVWYWKDHGFLTKELCMDVLHVLTENQITDHPILVSALALLDEQHPEYTELVMEKMQRDSGVPTFPLELFEVQPKAVETLSPVFIHVRGVLPFSLLGNEVLVAVLNPLNKALQEEVVARAGKPCHFFFAHPRTWQEMAKKI